MAVKARQVAKAAAAAAIHYAGLRGLLSSAARVRSGGSRLLILAYHRVVEDLEGESRQAIPGLLVSARTFERHIEELRRGGYELVRLEDALEVNAGLRHRRRDLVVLTFDDGYRDNYEVAFPLLQKHGVPATIFLPTAFVGSDQRLPHDRLYHLLTLLHARAAQDRGSLERVVGVDPWAPALRRNPIDAVEQAIAQWPSRQVLRIIEVLAARLGDPGLPSSGTLLDWAQCRTMLRSGLVGFGAHTVRHVPLHHEGPAEVERELRESRLTIERELGVACRDFAYPNGFYSKEIIRRLVRTGYRSAVTTEDAPNRIGGDPFKLRRKTLWENHSRGLDGSFSPSLLACQLEGVFGMLGLQRPVPGDRSSPPVALGGARPA